MGRQKTSRPARRKTRKCFPDLADVVPKWMQFLQFWSGVFAYEINLIVNVHNTSYITVCSDIWIRTSHVDCYITQNVVRQVQEAKFSNLTSWINTRPSSAVANYGLVQDSSVFCWTKYLKIKETCKRRPVISVEGVS
jgi:hypothetical protein